MTLACTLLIERVRDRGYGRGLVEDDYGIERQIIEERCARVETIVPGCNLEPLDRCVAALRLDRESAHRLNRVAEELETYRSVGTRGEEVDDATADGVLTDRTYNIDSGVAQIEEARLQRLPARLAARMQREVQFVETRARHQTLANGRNGRQNDARGVACEIGEQRQPGAAFRRTFDRAYCLLSRAQERDALTVPAEIIEQIGKGAFRRIGCGNDDQLSAAEFAMERRQQGRPRRGNRFVQRVAARLDGQAAQRAHALGRALPGAVRVGKHRKKIVGRPDGRLR